MADLTDEYMQGGYKDRGTIYMDDERIREVQSEMERVCSGEDRRWGEMPSIADGWLRAFTEIQGQRDEARQQAHVYYRENAATLAERDALRRGKVARQALELSKANKAIERRNRTIRGLRAQIQSAHVEILKVYDMVKKQVEQKEELSQQVNRMSRALRNAEMMSGLGQGSR